MLWRLIIIQCTVNCIQPNNRQWPKSVMIIFNSSWSILIQWIVRWQSDLVNTKKLLPVCNKPNHINKGKLQKAEGIEVLRIYAYCTWILYQFKVFWITGTVITNKATFHFIFKSKLLDNKVAGKESIWNRSYTE